jgi:hypothetical protein
MFFVSFPFYLLPELHSFLCFKSNILKIILPFILTRFQKIRKNFGRIVHSFDTDTDLDPTLHFGTDPDPISIFRFDINQNPTI